MPEARRGVHVGRVSGVSRNGGDEVVLVVGYNVKTVSAVSCQISKTRSTSDWTDVVVNNLYLETVSVRGRSRIHSNLLLRKRGGQAANQGCDQCDGLGHHCQAIWLTRF